MTDDPDLSTRVAILESMQESTTRTAIELRRSVELLRDSVTTMNVEITKMVASVTVIKWLLSLALPILPICGALVNRYLGSP